MRIAALTWRVTVASVLSMATVSAQSNSNPSLKVPAGCAVILKLIQTAATPQLKAQAIRSATDIINHPDCFAQELLVPAATTHLTLNGLKKMAKQSSNRQSGSTPGTSGTTSAVSQPFSLLSLASEYGGLTTSTNTGTFTAQTALDQFPTILAKNHVIGFCTPSSQVPRCINERALSILHRFSISGTFNTSSDSKTLNAMATGGSSGTAQQVSVTDHGTDAPSLAALTAKFVLFNDRADAASQWTTTVSNATDVTQSAQALAEKLVAMPDYTTTNYYYAKWRICTQNAFNAATDSDLPTVFVQYFSQLYPILRLGKTFTCKQDDQQVETQVETEVGLVKPSSPQPERAVVEALSGVQAALEDYAVALASLRDSIKTPVLSFEYDWNRPQNQPSNSVFKLIFSKNVLDSTKQNNVWTFTANVVASIYNSGPSATIPGASQLRDVQAGAEADRVLPKIWLVGQTTLSAAYYFQYQSSPSILDVTPGNPIPGITFTGLPSDATQVFVQKGNINLAQVKWAIGTGTNLRFPVAFSYSNRTELIAKPDWRGQFGISYDFSSLLSGGSGN